MLDLEEIKEKLDEFDSKIEADEKLKANLEGKRDTIIERLKDEYGITEKDDIEKIIKDNEEELGKIELDISKKMKELEEDYDWEE